MQGIYHCRAGDFIWNIYQLAFGACLLDFEDSGDFLREYGDRADRVAVQICARPLFLDAKKGREFCRENGKRTDAYSR